MNMDIGYSEPWLGTAWLYVTLVAFVICAISIYRTPERPVRLYVALAALLAFAAAILANSPLLGMSLSAVLSSAFSLGLVVAAVLAGATALLRRTPASIRAKGALAYALWSLFSIGIAFVGFSLIMFGVAGVVSLL